MQIEIELYKLKEDIKVTKNVNVEIIADDLKVYMDVEAAEEWIDRIYKALNGCYISDLVSELKTKIDEQEETIDGLNEMLDEFRMPERY